MKNVIYLVVILLLTGSSNISAQASWSYSVFFNLKDKEGNEITKEDVLLNQKVRLYSGFHSFSSIGFDSTYNLLCFKQSTISTENRLAFIYNTDTTIFIIPTSKNVLKLGTLTLTGNVYNMLYIDNAFSCTRLLPDYSKPTICRLTYGQEYYKTDEEFESDSFFYAHSVLPRNQDK